MALQTSGAISIDDIATEFGGTAPHSINEYYRGGGLVPDTAANAGIPTSGQVSLDDFYGGDSVTTQSGQLWTWGYNKYGFVADNTTADKFSPVQIVSGGTDWVSLGGRAGVGTAIKSDGRLWMWGYNVSGAVGDNTTTNRSSPVQTVSGGTTWAISSAGAQVAQDSAVYAIKTDGRLWTWGVNAQYGSLGDNTLTNRSSPVQTVAGGTDWVALNATFNGGAYKTDGKLWLWGRAFFGSLGDNTVQPKSSPVQTVSGGTNWVTTYKASASRDVVSAIKTDGRLWVWGNNNSGDVGDNTSSHRSSPVQTVSGGTNWVSSNGPCGIKTDGRLWMWGYNNFALLGDNTITPKSSPVQTVAGGTNWAEINSGPMHTAGIKTDGRLWMWGLNEKGSLGISSPPVSSSSPVQTVSGGTTWYTACTGLGYAPPIGGAWTSALKT